MPSSSSRSASQNPNNQPIRYKKLDPKKIKIKRQGHPIQNNIMIHDLTYENTRRPIIFQTPKLYLPFGVSKRYQSEDKYMIDISVNPKADEDTQFFHDLLNRIDYQVQINLPPKAEADLLPSLKQSEDSHYPPKLRTKIDPQIKLQVFNTFNEPQPNPLDYITPGSWAKSLLLLKNLWYSTQTQEGGLTYYILQAKVETPIPVLNQCLIEDETWDEERLCSICYSKILKAPITPHLLSLSTHSSHSFPTSQSLPTQSTSSAIPPPPSVRSLPLVVPSPPPPPPPPISPVYQQYFKMLKLGIPLVAVIQKCQLDGNDPTYITDKNKRPPPTDSLRTSSALPFSANDLKSARSLLSNAKDTPHPDPNKKLTLSIKPRDPRVPSLNMVLNKLQSLRPTPTRKQLLKQAQHQEDDSESSSTI